MASKKISEITAYTTPLSADVLPINDTANTETKKVTVANLFNILSSLFRIKDSTDTTKKIAFDASGITTATTRTVTMPDSDLTMVGTATTQTLTNKTLTSPVLTTPRVTTSINDANGNEVIITPATASAVNEVTVRNAATGNNPSIEATGGDTNIGLDFLAKGTGEYRFKGTASNGAEIQLFEDSDNGSNFTGFKAPASLAVDLDYTLPTANGTTGQFLSLADSSAKTLVWASAGAASAVTLIPTSAITTDNTAGSTQFNSNTTARVGQIVIPFSITVNKISFRANTVNAAGTFDLSLYSEDGQTQLFSVTSANVDTNNTVYTTSVSAVTLSPGIYYLAVNPNSTADVTIPVWQNGNQPFSVTAGLPFDVTSEPIMQGTYTISADTPPATLTLASITEAIACTVVVRLDN